MSSAGAGASVSPHGRRFLLSDVGDAASASDGQLFTFVDDGTVDGNVMMAAVGGPATLLGNPVDVIVLNGDAIVAEKSNDAILVFENVASLSGDVLPDYRQAFTKRYTATAEQRRSFGRRGGGGMSTSADFKPRHYPRVCRRS